MTAAQLLTGSGGLECTGLSRWKTIFAGTFLKENWLEMLHYFVDMQNTSGTD
jgi:hypothetical protein